VGTALSTLDVAPETVVVAEASSFQLEDTLEFAPDVAALINLGSDHLDRHGSLDAYREAKMQAFARQVPEQLAVIPDGLSAPGEAARVRFESCDAVTREPPLRGSGAPTADLRLVDGVLVWRGEDVMPAAEIRLRGPHNLQNAMVAAAVALAHGVDPRPALSTFAGVAHRLEEVATRDGVLYVNDSKATNVESTVMALRAFPSGVHLILGGRGKGQDFGPLRAAAAACRSVHLIGEDAERIRDAIGTGDLDGDLERAVAHARSLAEPGEVVLLSPAAASYDQYPDFEARGEHFRRIVG
jgi:UDP-N-acetylmuramoylalanine--D-glutamate ligase